jgi:SAM-dependent methyltransferase
MSIAKTAKTKAFGVEQGHATYRLRQARYYEIGLDVGGWAARHFQETGEPLDLIDIGTSNGLVREYIEPHPGSEHVRYHAVDLFPRGKQAVYKWQDWTLHEIDLDQGMPTLGSNRYDLVIAEQVLEHLHNPGLALAEMARIVRPGGRLVIGVPIFPPGLWLLRKHVVPALDRRQGRQRSHVQAWSKSSFVRLVRQSCPDLILERTRGFRIISGGVLRPLEYCRWWWRLNRRIGAAVPSLCIEIQVVARKRGGEVAHGRRAA